MESPKPIQDSKILHRLYDQILLLQNLCSFLITTLTDYQPFPETYHDYSCDSRQPAPNLYPAFRNYNTDQWTIPLSEGIFPRLQYISVQEA